MKWTLWSAFAVASIISLLFLLNKTYLKRDWIIGNLIVWAICGLIYSGEFIYNKVVNGTKS